MPKIVDHEEYKKELLEKCFDLFCRKGYQQISMREIGKEIGVSTGTLYHYFSSKEETLSQMLSWAIESNVEEFSFNTKENVSFQEKLKKISDVWIDSEKYYQNLMALVIDMVRSGTVAPEKIFKYFSTSYSSGLEKSLNVSQEASKLIFVHLLGIIFHSLVTPNEFNYKDEISSMRKILEVLLKEGESSEVDLLREILQEKPAQNPDQ